MVLNIKKDDKLLSVKINLKSSVAMLLVTEEELTARTLNRETYLEKVDSNIEFKVGEDIVYPLGVTRDIVYTNKHLLFYNPVNDKIIMIPDVSYLIGVFGFYNVTVDGISLGSDIYNRNDNIDTTSIGHKFPYTEPIDENDSMRIKLDINSLDDIKISTIALNIPGTIGTANLKYPTFISTTNGNSIKYDNSYVGLGVEITFGTDDSAILSKIVNSSIILGSDVKNIRSKHLKVDKEVLNKFKKIYIVE